MLKLFKNKKGSEAVENPLVLILITLVLVGALTGLGLALSKQINSASSSISKESACGIVHGYYDAAAGNCYKDSSKSDQAKFTWDAEASAWK